MTCGVLWVRDEFVSISMHDSVGAILGPAPQLVCRTRAREATILNRGLQVEAPLGTSARGLLVGHGTGGMAVYRIDDPFFLRTPGRLESMLTHIRRPAKTLILRMGNVLEAATERVGVSN